MMSGDTDESEIIKEKQPPAADDNNDVVDNNDNNKIDVGGGTPQQNTPGRELHDIAEEGSDDEQQEDSQSPTPSTTDVNATMSNVDATATDDVCDDEASSVLSSDIDYQTGTVVRNRRDGNAFLGESGACSGAEDYDGTSSSSDDEYIGLIPMLCSRCLKTCRKGLAEHHAKRFVISVNVISTMLGCFLLCIGLWMLICQDTLFYGVLLLNNPATKPSIVIDNVTTAVITMGLLISIIAFVGACGATTECICFLGFHAILAVLSLLSEIFFAIVFAARKSAIHASMANSLRYQIRYQYNISGSRIVNVSSMTYRVTAAWNQLQQQLECCGSYGPSDYHYSAWFNHTPDSDGSFVPLSCCHSFGKNSAVLDTSRPYYCQFEAVAVLQNEYNSYRNFPFLHTPQLVQAAGCYDAILNWFTKYSPLFAIIIIAVNVIIVIDIIYSFLLIRIARRKQADYTWCDDGRY